MKTLLTTLAMTLAASAAYAGSLAYTAPAAPVIIEEAAPMGGSGMWLIPLLAIALIALAMNNGQGSVVNAASR